MILIQTFHLKRTETLQYHSLEMSEPNRDDEHTEEEWSLEQMNAFCMKLGFIQCEMQESIDSPSVQDFHHVHEVGCTCVTKGSKH